MHKQILKFHGNTHYKSIHVALMSRSFQVIRKYYAILFKTNMSRLTFDYVNPAEAFEKCVSLLSLDSQVQKVLISIPMYPYLLFCLDKSYLLSRLFRLGSAKYAPCSCG